MHVSYGDVDLNQPTIERLDRRAVFVGKNYAYSRIILTVTAHVNRATQADTPRQTGSGQGGILTGGFANGPGPVVSDVALRNYLLQPRQKLTFSFLGTKSLVSPLDGDPTDVTGGPIPLSCDVIERTPATWKIRWTVQTDLNEAPTVSADAENSAPYILAQLVSMSDSLSEDYFTRRTIEGTVLFNLPSLINAGLVPDDFRFLLVVPPPIDFKRVKVDVQNDPEEPGLIRYRVEDLQLPFGWAGSHVSRLKATHSVRTTKQPTIQSVGGGIVRGIEGLAVFGKGGAIAPIIEGLFGAVPVSVHNVEVECWGDSLSTRDGLENFARRVIAGRLQSLQIFQQQNAAAAIVAVPDALLAAAGNAIAALTGLVLQADPPKPNKLGGTGLYGMDFSVIHSITEKHVLLNYTALSGPITSLIMGVTTDILAPSMAGMESTVDAFTKLPLIDPALYRGPWPASSTATRGVYLANLVGAALQEPFTPPPDVPFSDGNPTAGIGQAYTVISLPGNIITD